MKLISIFKKPISVLLTFCFIFALSEISIYPAMAEFSPEEKKAVIEQKIKEANNKLDELDAESAGAKERLDALNKKIEYLEQEMKLVDNDVENGKADVASLQRDCEKTKKQF